MSCQLKFLEGEGDRDKVVVYDEAGKELAAHADMQHSKNYRQLRQNNAAMSQKVLAALGKSEEKLLEELRRLCAAHLQQAAEEQRQREETQRAQEEFDLEELRLCAAHLQQAAEEQRQREETQRAQEEFDKEYELHLA